MRLAPSHALALALFLPLELTAQDRDSTGRFVISGDSLRRLGVDDPRQALTAIPGVVLRQIGPGVMRDVPLRIRGSATGPAAYLDGVPLRHRLTGTLRPLPAAGLASLAVTTGAAGAAVPDAAGGVVEYLTRDGGERLTYGLTGQYGGLGYVSAAGAVGGPLGERGSLFVAATLQRHATGYRGTGAGDEPAWRAGATDTVLLGYAVPELTATTRTDLPEDGRVLGALHGRLRFGGLSVTGLVSGTDEHLYPGPLLMASTLWPVTFTRTQLAALNWSGAAGGAELRATLAYAHDRQESGPRLPLAPIAFPVSERYVRALRSNEHPLVPLEGASGQSNVALDRINPYGAFGWPVAGRFGTIELMDETRLFGRVEAARRLGAHRVAVGVDGDRATAAYLRTTTINVLELDAFRAEPTRLGAYVAAALAARDIAADVGLRLDRVSAGEPFPAMPGHTFTHPDWGTIDTTQAAYDAAVGRTFTPAQTRTLVSPRLAVRYRVAPGTTVHAGFARELELPDLRSLYGRSNVDLAFTSATEPFGRDVSPGHSTVLEAGVRRAAAHWTASATLYRRRLARYTWRFTAVPAPFDGTAQLLMLTLAHENATGLDVGLAVRGHSRFAADGAYSLLSTGDTLHHAVHVALAADVGAGIGAVATLRAVSGLPYLLQQNLGLGTVTPARDPSSTALGERRLPWITVLDLRVARRVGGVEVFADARNVLDLRSLVAAYAETGSDENAAHRANFVGGSVAVAQAQSGSAAQPDGSIVLPADCGAFPGGDVGCVGLTRAERRFGNGDRTYTVMELERAFTAEYAFLYPRSRFALPGRTVRVGVSVR